jgi:hypothetical protein
MHNYSATTIQPFSFQEKIFTVNFWSGSAMNNIQFYNIFQLANVQRTTIAQRPFNPLVPTSVAEPHHFYAAPAPDENFDVALAPTGALKRQTCMGLMSSTNF